MYTAGSSAFQGLNTASCHFDDEGDSPEYGRIYKKQYYVELILHTPV